MPNRTSMHVPRDAYGTIVSAHERVAENPEHVPLYVTVERAVEQYADAVDGDQNDA